MKLSRRNALKSALLGAIGIGIAPEINRLTASTPTAQAQGNSLPAVTHISQLQELHLEKDVITNIPWEQAILDENDLWNLWNPATPEKVYVKTPGLYQLKAIAVFTANGQTAAESRFHVGIRSNTNLSVYGTGAAHLADEPSLWLQSSYHYLIYDTQRQYVFVDVKSNDNNTSLRRSYLEITRVR